MPNNELAEVDESHKYEVITYIDTIAFKYKLPNDEEEKAIEHELKIVWEDTLEKFLEEHGNEKPYKIHTFRRELERNNLIEQIDGEAEDLLDEVQEEIANKMKFGFDFSGQLHNDD